VAGAQSTARRRRAVQGKGEAQKHHVSPAGYLEWVTTIAGATTLVGALLFYFGWARSSATFSYFGIEADVLGLSFQDYLLRSVRSTYQPLLGLTVAALGAVALHRLLAGSPGAFPVGVAFLTFGSISVLFGLLSTLRVVTLRVDWPLVPVAYLAGAVLVVYGTGLMMAVEGLVSPDSTAVGVSRHPLVAGVILLLAFWVVSSYAGYRGTAVAEQITGQLDRRPSVVVLSEKDLRLHGSGVHVERIQGVDSNFAYCYSGLRFLIRSGGRQFLLPEHWRRGRDPVIVLNEDESTRFEYFRSRVASDCR
jgi:hypothetical protein